MKLNAEAKKALIGMIIAVLLLIFHQPIGEILGIAFTDASKKIGEEASKPIVNAITQNAEGVINISPSPSSEPQK